jgi:hypothetical protein
MGKRHGEDHFPEHLSLFCPHRFGGPDQFVLYEEGTVKRGHDDGKGGFDEDECDLRGWSTPKKMTRVDAILNRKPEA